MSNRAIIMLCPLAQVAVANASFAKLGLGPSMLSALYAAASDPTTVTHHLCHWNNPSAAITATVGQMVSGTLPTECLDEFDRPISITWDDPTELDALAAMAAITFKSIPYDDPGDYDPQAEVAAIADLAGLVIYDHPAE